MCLTINIYYSGMDGSARAFAQEMVASGIVADATQEKGVGICQAFAGQMCRTAGRRALRVLS